jgi:iron complex outermembrane receptor protein
MSNPIRFFFGLLFFLLPGALQAQYTLKGRVTVPDGRTNAATGAHVVLLPEGKLTFTDANGAFSFTGITAPECTVRVSLNGCQPEEQIVTLLPGLITELVFRLERDFGVTDVVLISALRASSRTATTFSNLTKAEIQKANFGQDLPFILNQLPGTVVSSDAGAGIGYTGIRIRGSDPTRTNVTINGIPLNDPESHGVFWVNLPDLASSVDNIQVQRGVGTSTNGAAAFGATINLQTTTLQPTAYAELTNGYGSFNSRRHTLSAGTGLIGGRFAIDTRLSRITSDGFVDRAFSDLSSWFVSGSYYGKKSLLKLNVFSGKEQTYQSWWGLPEALLETNRTWNYYTYENETDNYQQDHYQLMYAFSPSDKWEINLAGHYTYGRGYFEQFRESDDFSTYGFSPIELGDSLVATTDLIRRRWLDNHFYGTVFSATWKPSRKLTATLGGGANQYLGDHFGEVIWARFASASSIRDRFYESNSVKNDANTYLKLFWEPSVSLRAYLDLQVRQIGYTFEGTDIGPRPISGDFSFTFFNPKAGLTWFVSDVAHFYTSFSVAHREPVRNDFVDAPQGIVPQPEVLRNLEAGYRYRNQRISLSINGYWMDYTNQLVLNGELNDVGAAIRQNVPDSYRLGLEAVAEWRLVPDRLTLAANAAFSRNKIRTFEEVIYYYDADFNFEQTVVNTFRNTDISFSPNVVAGATLTWNPVKQAEVAWLSKYVGAQFLDNTGNTDRRLDPFWVNDLRFSYAIRPAWMREINLGLQVNNVFNHLYEPNGYTFNYGYAGELIVENFYYPMAGINWMGMVTLKF